MNYELDERVNGTEDLLMIKTWHHQRGGSTPARPDFCSVLNIRMADGARKAPPYS